MDILVELLTVSNVMLCFAIMALVWMQRKVVEMIMSAMGKCVKESKWWREIFLPMGPIGTGALLMLIPGMPVPEMFNSGSASKMVFGVGLGLMSGLIFRVLWKMLLDKGGLKSEEKSEYDDSK